MNINIFSGDRPGARTAAAGFIVPLLFMIINGFSNFFLHLFLEYHISCPINRTDTTEEEIPWCDIPVQSD